jgi:hypothetical protein
LHAWSSQLNEAGGRRQRQTETELAKRQPGAPHEAEDTEVIVASGMRIWGRRRVQAERRAGTRTNSGGVVAELGAMEGGVDRQGEVERRRLGRASLGNNSVALEASGKEPAPLALLLQSQRATVALTLPVLNRWIANKRPRSNTVDRTLHPGHCSERLWTKTLYTIL